MHGKTSPVLHDGTGLFRGLPSPFTATRYHSLIVNDVPDTLVVNARAEDGTVMGFRHATLPSTASSSTRRASPPNMAMPCWPIPARSGRGA